MLKAHSFHDLVVTLVDDIYLAKVDAHALAQLIITNVITPSHLHS